MTEYGDIYLMRSKGDNIPYVGITNDFKRRKKEHKTMLKKQSHHSYKINEYCINNNKNYTDFYTVLLEKSVSLAQIGKREKYWIRYFDSFENGFNCTPGDDKACSIRKSKEVVYNNKIFSSISVAAEYYGITREGLQKRIRENLQYDKIGRIPHTERGISEAKIKYKNIVWNGIVYDNLLQLSLETGIKLDNLYYYRRCGYNCDEDIKKSNSNKRRSANLLKKCVWNNVEYKSIKDAANAIGTTQTNMSWRIKRGFTCDNDIEAANNAKREKLAISNKKANGKRIIADGVGFYCLNDAVKFYGYAGNTFFYTWLKTGKAQYID